VAQTQAEISAGMKVILDILQLYFCTTLIKRLVFAILLSVAKMDKNDAARLAGICEKSGRAYIKKLENDPQTYMMIGSGGRPQKLDSVKIELLEEIDCGIYRTLREIRVKIQAMFSISISKSRLRVFLKNHGYRKLCSASMPAKANPKEQREFYADTMLPLMAGAKRGEVHLLFMDASHFIYGIPKLSAIYGRVRRIVNTSSGRLRYNVLAVIDFVTKQILTVQNETYITAASVKQMMDKLVQEYVGKTIALVLDNARYQHCKAVEEYAEQLGIYLVFLPSYSPNLNLIERLWKHIKAEVYNSIYQETFKDFKQFIDTCINKAMTINKPDIDRLISYKVQLYDDNRIPILFDNLSQYIVSTP
jgi:transposase